MQDGQGKMTSAALVSASLERARPHAKFSSVSHSTEFMDPGATPGTGFFVAFVYDEDIDSNMFRTKHGVVLVQNSYISSFAYSLFFCRLCDFKMRSAALPLDKLLRHNIKKFFAEQAYRKANRIPARGLLLETMLFEQKMMVDATEAASSDPGIAEESETAAHLMSLALSMHEVGHYMLDTRPDFWAQIEQFEPDTVGFLYASIRGESAEIMREFQCDAYAVLSCFRHYGELKGKTFALRAIAFAFAAYSAMYSARASAESTAAVWNETPDEVDFLDISPMGHVDHPIRWSIDAPFLRRAHLVRDLCERLAERNGVELYGGDDPFPLSRTIVEDLTGYVGEVFDSQDRNARSMANVVAQALTGHEAGMEYLYLRSKTFTTQRETPLKVNR